VVGRLILTPEQVLRDSPVRRQIQVQVLHLAVAYKQAVRLSLKQLGAENAHWKVLEVCRVRMNECKSKVVPVLN
jgi:hypothetical protein